MNNTEKRMVANRLVEMHEMADKMNAKLDDMIRTLKIRKIMRSDKATPAVKADILDVLRSIANDM